MNTSSTASGPPSPQGEGKVWGCVFSSRPSRGRHGLCPRSPKTRRLCDTLSLKKDSVVGTQVHIDTKKAGAKTPAEKNYRPIYKWELDRTRDRLTKEELKAIQSNVKNDTPEHRATHEKTMQKWHNGFKNEE